MFTAGPKTSPSRLTTSPWAIAGAHRRERVVGVLPALGQQQRDLRGRRGVVGDEQDLVADRLDDPPPAVHDDAGRGVLEPLQPRDELALVERLAARGVADDVDEADRELRGRRTAGIAPRPAGSARSPGAGARCRSAATRPAAAPRPRAPPAAPPGPRPPAATFASSVVSHSASRAKLRPHVRTSAACESSLRMPSRVSSSLARSASTSASVKATSSSSLVAKPSSRHSCTAISRGTPARSATSIRVRLGASPSRCSSTVSSSPAGRAGVTGSRRRRRAGGRSTQLVPRRASVAAPDGVARRPASRRTGDVRRSSVKWISSSGVSATIEAVRSEWLTIAASPKISPGPSWATSVALDADRDRAVEQDVGLVGRGLLPDRRPALRHLHGRAGGADPRHLLRSERVEERDGHGEAFRSRCSPRGSLPNHRRCPAPVGPRSCGSGHPGAGCPDQSTGSGSRVIGQLMQRGPPRPEPSSEPAIRTTSMPASSRRSLVSSLRS